MVANMKISSPQLLKQLIIFIIIFQSIFCVDLNKSNIENGANTLNNSSTPTILRQIQAAYETSQLHKLSLCVTKIKSGEIREALKYFDELKSVSIADIINKTYPCDNINEELIRLKNILEFIRQQPSSKHDKLAFQTLYELMKPSNDLYSFKGALLLHSIEQSYEKDDLSIRYMKLMLKNIYLKQFKQRWVNVLLNGVYDRNLRDFDRDYYEYFSPLLFDIFLKEIKIKNNLMNKFDNILSFIINYFNAVEHLAIAYSELFTELDKNDLLANINIRTKLGKDIKDNMLTQSNYERIDKSYRDKIENICNALESCKL